MRKTDKQNAIVIATIVLCFMLTLGMCYALSGSGFLATFAKEESGGSYYAVCSGNYTDITLARSAAELVKTRGGAGYVISGELKEIVLAVYPDKSAAESVVGQLRSEGAYLKEIELKAADLKWAPKDKRDAVGDALGYFDAAFKSLYETSNGVADDTIAVGDVAAIIQVLNSRLNDIKSVFYQKMGDIESEQSTEIKLALVTAIALVDNVETDGSKAKVISSLRYQTVQLVLCRQALLNSL